jgi:serine/threonine-protein kinase RsbW
MVVPTLADICLIDMVIDGSMVRMAGAHADPDYEVIVKELMERYPPDAHGSHPAAQTASAGLMQSGAADGEFLRSIAHDERKYQLFTQLGCHSYICVPWSLGAGCWGR